MRALILRPIITYGSAHLILRRWKTTEKGKTTEEFEAPDLTSCHKASSFHCAPKSNT